MTYTRPSRPRSRPYDAAEDRYTLSAAELANLAKGARRNALIAAGNRAQVRKLAAAGHTAADIVMITGLARATVYRHMP